MFTLDPTNRRLVDKNWLSGKTDYQYQYNSFFIFLFSGFVLVNLASLLRFYAWPASRLCDQALS